MPSTLVASARHGWRQRNRLSGGISRSNRSNATSPASLIEGCRIVPSARRRHGRAKKTRRLCSSRVGTQSKSSGLARATKRFLPLSGSDHSGRAWLRILRYTTRRVRSEPTLSPQSGKPCNHCRFFGSSVLTYMIARSSPCAPFR